VVRYLRRADANPQFVPRPKVEHSPFLVYGAWGGLSKTRMIQRMPGIGGGAPNGSVAYRLSADFPESHVATVSLVLEQWNDVIEREAGNRPLVLDTTTPAAPSDPRTRTIAWGPRDDEHSGYAVSLVDPFSGEAFDTDVFLLLGDVEEAVRERAERDPASDSNARSRAQRLIDRALGDGHSAMEAEALVVQDLLLHEIGHNLGMDHNFAATADYQHLEPGMPATSVMDYVEGMHKTGAYDGAVMAYAYGDGPAYGDFLSCNIWDIAHDPLCERWDEGDPFVHLTKRFERLRKIPEDADWSYVQNMLHWSGAFHDLVRSRQLVNTGQVGWDGTEPHLFERLLDLLSCDDGCKAYAVVETAALMLAIPEFYAAQPYSYDGEWVPYRTELDAAQRAQVKERLAA